MNFRLKIDDIRSNTIIIQFLKLLLVEEFFEVILVEFKVLNWIKELVLLWILFVLVILIVHHMQQTVGFFPDAAFDLGTDDVGIKVQTLLNFKAAHDLSWKNADVGQIDWLVLLSLFYFWSD